MTAHLAPKVLYVFCGIVSSCLVTGGTAVAGNILFIGNSFTYGQGSPVHFYRAASVTDLNGEGNGGVPSLFKSFTAQAGLSYDVYLETHPGIGLDWHLDHELGVIDRRPWDSVVLQGYSTLDAKKPGNPAALIDDVRKLSAVFRAKNPAVQLRLTATWPRADQTYLPGGAWYGKPIEAMAHDVRVGYDQAAAATPGIKGVVPVGDAWIRAIRTGVADGNPYDGIDAGKLDLWTYDNYHASTYGYYLEALLLFGSVTGRDPRSLGERECSGYELGLSMAQVLALEKVAFDQLAADGVLSPSSSNAPVSTVASPTSAATAMPTRCAPPG
jgi:hypothetical protein